VARDELSDVVASVLAAHPAQVARWQRSEPGAWGFLAGQVVLAYRRAVGRSLSDGERRRAWAAAWAALEATR
jgi:hypothetical protein